MQRTLQHLRPRLALLLSLALAACTSTNASARKAPPEMLLMTESVRVGTVLSGPLIERAPDELDWEDSWRFEVDVAYFDRLPAGGRPVSGRIVIVDGTSQVFGTESQLASSVRAEVDAGEVGERSWARHFVEPVPAGATAVVSAELGIELLEAGHAAWDRWAFEISRSAEDPGRVDAALVLEGTIAPRQRTFMEGDEGAPAATAPIEVRERIVLDAAPVLDGDMLRLIFPVPTRRAPDGGFIVEVRLATRTKGADDFDGVVARGRRLAEEAYARVLARVDALDESEGFRFESGSALRALNDGELHRPALIFLAQSTRATVTEELALIAAPETLGELIGDIARRTQDLEHLPEGAASFGWFLERSAFLWLCTRAEDGTREFEPELFAVLNRHAGEVSRYTDLLREAIATSGDADTLVATLTRVNRIFLEDAHPAARVRAYDWLVAHGATPAGFDPLGLPDARRAALARLDDEAEAVSASATKSSDGGER